MTGRAKLGLAAVVLGAVVATTGIPAAADKATPKLAATTTELRADPIHGLVVATYRPTARRVKASVSLHGLPLTDEELGGPDVYRVVAATRSCSQVVDAADYVVWSTIVTAQNEAALYDKSTPKLLKPFRSARSVRVYERSDGGKPIQRACGPAQPWATFPSS
jgi:hypothetical protein